MENLLNCFRKCSREDFFIGYDSNTFYELIQYFLNQFTQLKANSPCPKIFLVEPDPYRFLSAFLASIIADCHVFLCNHHWKQKEWQQIFYIVQPDLILGVKNPEIFQEFYSENTPIISPQDRSKHLIMIPTGGTSGKVRFAMHTWKTLSASVAGFAEFFEVDRVNSFCVLPVYHVSGLMQFMRSFLTGGTIAIVPYQDLKTQIKLSFDIRDFFISLVPTQLHYLLELQPDWLAKFKTVLLGGAPAGESLLKASRKYRINLASTYGMTETASQIVTLKPQYFLQGKTSIGQVLPHAKITIDDPKNQSSKGNNIGVITLKSTSLFLGYYPYFKDQEKFTTDDLGYFDSENYLYIVGRNSQKIITGGENVFPLEVESAILATGLVKDVSVIGIPHPQWGQAVTALYIPKKDSISSEQIKAALQNQLSQFKQPKSWISLKSLPRNQQGKLDYQKLAEIALSYLKNLS